MRAVNFFFIQLSFKQSLLKVFHIKKVMLSMEELKY